MSRPALHGVVNQGYASVKEDGFRSFIWSKRWLQLHERRLAFHRNESSTAELTVIALADVESVQRTNHKEFCLEIVTKEKSYYLAFKSDDEVYNWMDQIYSRSPVSGISKPTGFVHEVHVGVDPGSGMFTGLPPEWKQILDKHMFLKEEMTKNPQAVLDVLEFYTE
ncbi:PBD-domain-containing protein, partial [Caulochytrium protostelioides]